MCKYLFLNKNLPDEKMARLRIFNYQGSNAIYAVLAIMDTKGAWVPYRTITARPDQNVPIFYAAVKPCDKDLAELLIREGIAKATTELAHAGFHTLHLLSLNRTALMEYDRQGAEQYEKTIAARREIERLVK